MYDYIQEAIDKGECLLEWDGAHEDGPPPAPLLKDKFASERRKAKVKGLPHVRCCWDWSMRRNCDLVSQVLSSV